MNGIASGLSVAQRAQLRAAPGIPRLSERLDQLGLTKRAETILLVWGVTMSDVEERRRFLPIARARHHLWTLLHEEGDALAAIGRVSRVDHTTVLTAVRGHRARYGDE